MGQRVTKDDVLARKKQSERPSLSDAFVQLKADNGPSVTILRLFGYPYSFKEHTAFKRNPDDPKKPLSVPFPDAETNRAYTRVCTEDDPRFGACKYCELGYKATTRYSQRCLVRFKDENGVWKHSVKILCKGPTIFDEFAKFENSSAEMNEEDDSDSRCEFLGGEKAHDIRIKSEKNTKALGGVEHTVTVLSNKESIISEEEIASILALHTPSSEELDQLIALGLADEDEPIWYVGGYKLHEIHRPAKPPVSPAATSTHEDMTVDEDDNDDEDEAAPVAAPSKSAAKTSVTPAKGKASKAAPVVESELDDDELDPFAGADFTTDVSSMPF